MNQTIIPSPLKKGDTIGIISTARKVKPNEIQSCIDFYSSLGYQVITGSNLYHEHFQFAGTDKDRINDLQWMINNPDVKAIICARGGYGTVRIIDYIDFTPLLKNPKWIVGYSDITVIHSHLNKIGIATLHAPMAINYTNDISNSMYKNPENLKQTHDILSGKINPIVIENPVIRNNKTVSGKLIGGNLSVLYSISQSQSDFEYSNCILFIEDLDEYLYHLDRMMQWLKRSGKLNHLQAIIVGEMSDMKNLNPENPFGMDALEIIEKTFEPLGIPMILNFPAGHGFNNTPIILGREIKLDFSSDKIIIEYI